MKYPVAILFLMWLNVCAMAQTNAFTVKQCIEHAWTNLPQIKLLEQGKSISYEQLEQLKASMQPTLSFNASQNMNTGRSIDPFTYQFTTESIFSNNFSVNAGLNLFSGFKNVYSKQQQALLIEANTQNILKIKNDVALSIANQFLQVVLLKEQITALDTQVNYTLQQYQKEEMLQAAGRSDKNKLLQLKAQLLTEQNRKQDLTYTVKGALLNLQYAAAIVAPNFDIVVPELNQNLNQGQEVNVEDILHEAEKNMAVVQYAKINEAYFTKGIQVSKAGFYPSLTLNASLNTGYSSARKQNVFDQVISNQPIGYLFSNPSEVVFGPVIQNTVTQTNYSFGNQVKDNFSQFVGLSLRVPILTNRSNLTNVHIAQMNAVKAQLETENIMLNLKKDVETSVNAYLQVRDKYSRLDEINKIQQEVLSNANLYYTSGKISLFEVLTQKNNVLQANATFIQAKYELIFRKLVLDYYMGKPIDL